MTDQSREAPREAGDAAAGERSMTAEERARDIASTLNGSTFDADDPRSFEKKLARLLTTAIREAESAAYERGKAEERELWAPLYTLAGEIMIHHEGFMAAWRDKFSPEAIEDVERHRRKLLDVCAQVREATGLSGDHIQKLAAIRARGGDDRE